MQITTLGLLCACSLGEHETITFVNALNTTIYKHSRRASAVSKPQTSPAMSSPAIASVFMAALLAGLCAGDVCNFNQGQFFNHEPFSVPSVNSGAGLLSAQNPLALSPHQPTHAAVHALLTPTANASILGRVCVPCWLNVTALSQTRRSGTAVSVCNLYDYMGTLARHTVVTFNTNMCSPAPAFGVTTPSPKRAPTPSPKRAPSPSPQRKERGRIRIGR